jgi:outer membrane lipopolysaccharide assembly protein LptE/RlpB
MKLKLISAILVIMLFSGCGFKIVDNTNKYKITNIITSGDKRISYNLKNKLFLNTNENSSKILSITIDTKKIKSIYERDIKNEITKYSIRITVKVEAKDLTKNIEKKFSISDDGIYNVGSRHSVTKNNENQLIKLLTENLLEEILDKLSINFNDL